MKYNVWIYWLLILEDHPIILELLLILFTTDYSKNYSSIMYTRLTTGLLNWYIFGFYTCCGWFNLASPLLGRYKQWTGLLDWFYYSLVWGDVILLKIDTLLSSPKRCQCKFCLTDAQMQGRQVDIEYIKCITMQQLSIKMGVANNMQSTSSSENFVFEKIWQFANLLHYC